MRAIEGSPARESMIRWNKSQAAKDAWRRYYNSEHGRERHLAARRKGTPQYEKRHALRAEYRAAAANNRRRWSAADEQRLRDFVAAGEKEARIATILGRSLSGIMHKKRKMGLTVATC
ncbi:MAG: hypothetical protein EBR82_29650 [Caulobacteraceae bacterium]|nr:hypothetical protein [Caulobacteraceae bacterium]